MLWKQWILGGGRGQGGAYSGLRCPGLHLKACSWPRMIGADNQGQGTTVAAGPLAQVPTYAGDGAWERRKAHLLHRASLVPLPLLAPNNLRCGWPLLCTTESRQKGHRDRTRHGTNRMRKQKPGTYKVRPRGRKTRKKARLSGDRISSVPGQRHHTGAPGPGAMASGRPILE